MFDAAFEVENVTWLKGLPYTITLPDLGFIVVHAGLVPGCPLQEQTLDDMSTMKSLLQNPNRGFLTSSDGNDGGGMPWAEHWYLVWLLLSYILCVYHGACTAP